MQTSKIINQTENKVVLNRNFSLSTHSVRSLLNLLFLFPLSSFRKKLLIKTYLIDRSKKIQKDFYEKQSFNGNDYSLADFGWSLATDNDIFDKVKRLWRYFVFVRDNKQYTYRRVLRSKNDHKVSIDCPFNNSPKEMIMMASNDYLGLSNHDSVRKAISHAVLHESAGSASVPMLSGTYTATKDLEKKIANFYSREKAMVFPSGYAANVGIISAIVNRGDLVLGDRLNHASIQDGIKLSGAKCIKYDHNDLDQLESILETVHMKHKRILIVADGVFSMDGDVVDLPRMCSIARKYNARTMIDEAHAIGVIGRNGKGTEEYFDMTGQVDIMMGTLSKTIGQIGGYVAGSKDLICHLRHYSRSYFFSTALPPYVCRGIIEVFNVLEREQDRVESIKSNINYFKSRCIERGLPIEKATISAIIPLVVGDEAKLKELSYKVHEKGIYTNPIPFPAVAKDKTRFRISLMATHTKEEMDYVIDTFYTLFKEHNII